ncbi:MAG: methionine synthase [Candidatus Hodarchaeales archaeon]
MGSCVHVAGIFNFLSLARSSGYETYLLRPPNDKKNIIEAIKTYNPDIIALSYRLTPDSAVSLTKELLNDLPVSFKEKLWIFGGTTPVCEALKPLGFFSHFFDGSTTEVDIINFLRSRTHDKTHGKISYPSNLISRIDQSKPYPIFRAHFGLPSVEETIKGIEKIAKSKVLDVISIGPDQFFQENFFCENDSQQIEVGAGGVPVRSEKDLNSLYEASCTGNYPLLRCYSGTQNLIKMAELLKRTIKNAWAATPLFWYSELDGRSPRPLVAAIKENQLNMKWHGERGIPFECNEAHHWSLRSAPDAIAVAAAYLGAYNAKKFGVTHYISQLMFDTPLGISPRYDLAKMMAKTFLIESLHDGSFTSYRQVRTGLFSFPEDPDYAKAQLASSVQLSMFINPHIVHVVSFCEANHVATPDDVIESVKIARKIVSNSIKGLPSVTQDRSLQKYKKQLISDAELILEAIKTISSPEIEDPLIDASTLLKAVKLGILDAPHLQGLSVAKGEIMTSIVDGKCISIDKDTGEPISEFERINSILLENGYPTIEKSHSMVKNTA